MAPVEQDEWPPSSPIAQLPRRGRAVCAGVVDAVTIQSAGAAPVYTAMLTDQDPWRSGAEAANHRLRLVWIGRRRVPGIAAGVRLRVEGMISIREGLPTMYNPRYEIIGIQES